MSKWTMTQRQVWDIFVRPGEVIEVRIPKIYRTSKAWEGYAKGVVSGYFDNLDDFAMAVRKADKCGAAGLYFTMNPINPALIGRAFNRLKCATKTTTDADVKAIRWLLVDLDPFRPAGVSSSDEELAAALEKRDRVAEFIVEALGFPKPIRAMSGNGGHLLVRLPDLAPTQENRDFVQDTLEDLASKFNDDKVQIDTSVGNPARICRLYGSRARKGDEVPPGPHRVARPHRQSYIDDLGSLKDASDE